MDLLPRSIFYDDDFEKMFMPKSYQSEMKCDLYEKKNRYYIELDLPGYKKDDITIEVKDDYLTVTADKVMERDTEKKNYIRKERTYGKYTRTFRLAGMNTDEIEAKTKHGILYIKIPKLEEPGQTKTIKIK